MSKLQELQGILDKRFGITVKESNHDRETREIMQMKITLERIENGLREYKGLPRKNPVLLKESLQQTLDRRSGVHAADKKEKSDREDPREGLASMTRTRAGVRSGDILARRESLQAELDSRVELKESGACVVLSDETILISLREATYDSDLEELEAVLEGIPSGSATQLSGRKIYLNRPTPTQRRERPEGNLKDWVSTITEVWAEGAKAKARIAVHDTWLKERLTDPVAKARLQIAVEMKNGSLAEMYWLAH